MLSEASDHPVVTNGTSLTSLSAQSRLLVRPLFLFLFLISFASSRIMSATVVVLHRAHRISPPPTWRPYMKQDLVIPGSQIMVSV